MTELAMSFMGNFSDLLVVAAVVVVGGGVVVQLCLSMVSSVRVFVFIVDCYWTSLV